ncbi:uncharacterized protein SAPINGB_P003121 [Magnusiomyces paraingens]|uniref:Uncharacterized protein n=1 Tax=Magnusiomyces paraingens TaxID=2606893 RepID=A0A5E8BS02_9ASCO|nr:uncharacterized protein SAPINGB_P003121 [Saprochaete ingens]VVT51513.1 unnamed protein product [Saprochaete ingens]
MADRQRISQTCLTLRSAYFSRVWKACTLVNTPIDVFENLSQALHCIPEKIFFQPHQYSWFPCNEITKIIISECPADEFIQTVTFDASQFPALKLIQFAQLPVRESTRLAESPFFLSLQRQNRVNVEIRYTLNGPSLSSQLAIIKRLCPNLSYLKIDLEYKNITGFKSIIKDIRILKEIRLKGISRKIFSIIVDYITAERYPYSDNFSVYINAINYEENATLQAISEEETLEYFTRLPESLRCSLSLANAVSTDFPPKAYDIINISVDHKTPYLSLPQITTLDVTKYKKFAILQDMESLQNTAFLFAVHDTLWNSTIGQRTFSEALTALDIKIWPNFQKNKINTSIVRFLPTMKQLRRLCIWGNIYSYHDNDFLYRLLYPFLLSFREKRVNELFGYYDFMTKEDLILQTFFEVFYDDSNAIYVMSELERNVILACLIAMFTNAGRVSAAIKNLDNLLNISSTWFYQACVMESIMLVIEECDFLEYLEIKTDRGYYVSPGLMSLCHKSNLKQIFVNTKLNWHKNAKDYDLEVVPNVPNRWFNFVTKKDNDQGDEESLWMNLIIDLEKKEEFPLLLAGKDNAGFFKIESFPDPHLAPNLTHPTIFGEHLI